MAVEIPIISEFDGKGIKKAIAQFKQLETTGEKAQFVLKKAALGAGVALAGLAVAVGDATKAAMEDAQAQAQLAKALQNTTGATKSQIASTEAFISKLTLATGVADDKLRPALAALVRGTRDIDAAQRSLTLAMDISTATGMDLVTVSDALAKAYQGNMRGLRALSPEMATLIKEGASLDEVMKALSATFGGATAANAETAAGKMQILQNSMNEAKESIGAAFLPVLESLLPYLQRFADWAGKNTDQLVKLTYVVGGTTAAVIALNFAMNANPMVALTTYTIAATAAIAGFRAQFQNLVLPVRAAVDQLSRMLSPLLGIIDAYNAIAGFMRLPKITLGKTETASQVGFGGISFGPPNLSSPMPIPVPQIGTVGGAPGGSSGGQSAGAAPAMAAIPYVPSGIDPFMDNPFVRRREGGNLTVHVNGGLATSADIGAAVVDAIKQYTNVSGPADIRVA